MTTTQYTNRSKSTWTARPAAQPSGWELETYELCEQVDDFAPIVVCSGPRPAIEERLARCLAAQRR